jgi:predicted porin
VRATGISARRSGSTARLESRSRSGTVDWLDATGGLRVRLNPLSYVHIIAESDGGGGGSHSTWQAVGNVTYDFSKHYSAVAGYRYLDVNYDRSGFLFDTHTNGWLIGLNIRVGP